MEKAFSASLLAAFATIKSLSEANKYQSHYQLLAEFIRYIITENVLYSFEATKMKNLLNEQFGFVIPESVVKTAARNMAGVTLSDGVYTVSFSELGSDSLFEEKKKEADDANSDIIALLIEYIWERTGNSSVCKEELTRELVGFLVGEQSPTGKYIDLIGEFVLKNEHNTEIQKCLNNIKEGSIFYIGLNHNISETGSITKPLTLYLGTEILFSLVGYNGEIYKQLATDFYKQVKAANKSGVKKITLHYFSDVKKEIDEFFLTAEDIADGKRTQLINKPAMSAITNGCTTSSDIAIKKSEFYYSIQYGFGITEDPHDNYYDELTFESNLESFDYVDEDDKNSKRETGIKYISHINKLRNGKIPINDIDSEYLLITNTKATLLISREQVDRIKEEHGIEQVSSFAVSLDRITSLLWYKLGNGFGNKDFPASISVVLRARVVLSASIAKNAERVYSDIKKQYEAGNISKELLASHIITLRNKPKLPEELQGDDIVEIMDFSPEFLSKYEEEHKTTQRALEEKDRILNEIKKEADAQLSARDATIASQTEIIAKKNKFLSEKDAQIETQNIRIKTQDEENENLRSELEKYHCKEENERHKKERIKNILLFIWNAIWKILVASAVVAVCVWICNKNHSDISNIVGIVTGVLSFILAVIPIIKKDCKKYLSKK